eukprot:8450147-Ditylum_brightwellii.AAC.1
MDSMSEERSSNGSQVRQRRRSTLLNATGAVIVLAVAAALSSIPCRAAYVAVLLHKIAGQRTPAQRGFGLVWVASITAVMDMPVDDNHSVSMMPNVTSNMSSMTNAIKQKMAEEATSKKACPKICLCCHERLCICLSTA